VAAGAEPELVAPEPPVAAEPEPVTEPETPIVAEAEATPEPEPEIVTEESPLPPAIAAAESGRQAAWELGRLPILLDASIAPRGSELPEAVEPEADPEVEQPVAAVEPTTRWTGTPSTRAREQRPVELRAIEWLPVGPDPEPAPIAGIEVPEHATPASIERLDAGLDARRAIAAKDLARAREEHAADGDRLPRAPAARAADARHRISRRRAELGGLVAELDALTSHRD
jgi:hypothetical protein